MEKLAPVRDSLRGLALYFLESSIRAKDAGATTAAMTVDSLAAIAATIFHSVIAIESLLGTPPPSSPTPQPSPIADYKLNLDRMNEDIRRRQEEINKAVAAMQDAVRPPPPPEPVP